MFVRKTNMPGTFVWRSASRHTPVLACIRSLDRLQIPDVASAFDLTLVNTGQHWSTLVSTFLLAGRSKVRVPARTKIWLDAFEYLSLGNGV